MASERGLGGGVGSVLLRLGLWAWRRGGVQAVVVVVVVVVVAVVLGDEAVGGFVLLRGVRPREDILRAADEVLVHQMGGRVAGGPFLRRGLEVVLVVQAEDLDAAREGLVSAFLVAAAVEFFLVSERGVRVVGEVEGDAPGEGGAHVVESVRFDCFVVEPGAVAGFPALAADHAEFGAAAAGHVVAAFFEFDGRFAVEACYPAFLLGDLDEFLRGRVFGAGAGGVPFAVAGTADFGSAAGAFAVFAAAVGAAGDVCVDVGGFDPFAAVLLGAVDAVFGCEFTVFLVPLFLEFKVEEFVDMFEVDVVRGAAFRGHVLGIGNTEGEDAAEAGVAHPVVAE